MWQQPDSINSGHTVLLEVFVGLVALAMMVQAIAVVIVAVGARKAQKDLMNEVAEIKGKLLPLMEKSHGLVTELGPKISNITANVEHISFVVREKVVEFEPTVSAANQTIKEANATARDVNAKAHAQVIRVNGMVTSVLNATAEIGEKIHHGIRVPVREIEGIVGGVKAAVDSLISRGRGFGGGVRTEPVRPSARAGYGARTASSVVRPPHSAGVEVVAVVEEPGEKVRPWGS
jgi:hypothetical protein